LISNPDGNLFWGDLISNDGQRSVKIIVMHSWPSFKNLQGTKSGPGSESGWNSLENGSKSVHNIGQKGFRFGTTLYP
jgi:hypothetical protein